LTAHILLNEEQFRQLLKGGEATDSAVIGPAGGVQITLVVKIALADIGFPAMRQALDDAERVYHRGA
jgi:hypothetical protein